MAMNNIFGLFAQSPLTPLQKLAFKVTECSELLEPFLRRLLTMIGIKQLILELKLLI